MPIRFVPSTMFDNDPRPVALITSDMNTAGDWATYVSGTGAVVQFVTSVTDQDRIGVGDCQTGSTATGYAGIGSSAVDMVSFGARAFRFVAIAKLVNLSDGTNSYRAWIGFADRRNATNATDGVYFSYTHNVGGGNWQAETYSNNLTAGPFDTGIAADTNWHRFEISVDKAAAQIRFWIDGALVYSAGAGSPSGTARATGVSVQIAKSLGTTTRSLYVDKMTLEMDTAR